MIKGHILVIVGYSSLLAGIKLVLCNISFIITGNEKNEVAFRRREGYISKCCIMKDSVDIHVA